jgi:cellulose synthase (UDP-forming)
VSTFVGGIALRRPALARNLAVFSLALSSVYLSLRVLETQSGANPVAFWLLISAEAFGVLTLALLTVTTWKLPRPATQPGLEVSCDIVVTTYDEDISVLEPTLVSSLRVEGVGAVWVLDDGARETVRLLCAELGVKYLTREDRRNAKAGNINNALRFMRAEFLLFLDADHVPTRAIIRNLSGYFRDSKVAIVQTPQGFRNADSLQHRDGQRHEQSLFFDVLLPARDPRGSAFWCGSGAMVRTAALIEVGGVATQTVTEDLHTSLRLQLNGWKIRYHQEHLAVGLAPHNATAFFLQRERWARGTIQVLFSKESPIFGRGWSLAQRWDYFSSLLYYLMPLQRLVFAAVVLMTLVWGILPVGNLSLPLLGLLVVHLVLSTLASSALARGQKDASEGVEFTWFLAGTHLAALVSTALGVRIPFRVTPKSNTHLTAGEKLGFLLLPIVTAILLAAALSLRVLFETGALQPLPGAVQNLQPVVLLFAIGFGLFELLILLRLIGREMGRRQLRSLWRFPVSLPAAVNEHPVTITDMHELGMSFRGPAEASDPNRPVPFRIPYEVPGEPMRQVAGHFAQTRRIKVGADYIHAGEISWRDASSRRDALDLCYSIIAKRQTG